MEKKDKQPLKNARQLLSNELHKFVKASGNLLEPLKELNDTQVAALVTLGFSIRIIMLAGRAATNLHKDILRDFKEVVDEICPPLGKVAIDQDPCFESTVSYVSALKSCEDEDPPRDEEECFEAWGPGAQAVMCIMKELEDMRAQLGDLFGRLKPPRPFPWLK